MKIAVAVSRFNQNITQRLLAGALKSAKLHRVKENSVRVVWVSGAFELPLAAQTLAQTKKYSAVVCLGCVLQGETAHNRYISESAASGIMSASLRTGVPITFGVLTPDNMNQALKRSEMNSANKGSEAMEAAIELAATVAEIRKAGK